jgi:hypothetical protein
MSLYVGNHLVCRVGCNPNLENGRRGTDKKHDEETNGHIYEQEVSFVHIVLDWPNLRTGDSCTRQMVYVTLCRWPSGMQVWVPPKPAYQTVIYTECHIPDIVLIQLILLMIRTRVFETCRDWNKHIRKKEIVRQVGYLQELYRDAPSAKRTIKSVNTRHDTQTSPLFLLGYRTASLQALLTL